MFRTSSTTLNFTKPLSQFSKAMTNKLKLRLPDLKHQRSNEIISFCLRNHAATNNAIRYQILPDISVSTVQKIVSKLIKRGLLKRYRLHASKSYLRLGQSSIARWGYPASYSRRLGPQVLPYLLGCLSLTTYSKPPLKRLLPSELDSMVPNGFPESRDLNQWAYYRQQENGTETLFTIRVEFRVGGDAVINKLSEQIHRYRQHPSIAKLIADKSFGVHVVTATAEQEEAVHSAAVRLGFPVSLRTSHDPDLTSFL